MNRSHVPSFPSLVQNFFCQYLVNQRNASPQTVAAYRDAFRLLLQYAQRRTRKSPTALTLKDINAPLVLGFLDHLEKVRGNSVRSRNARRAAVRSFLHYASLQDPSAMATIQRVLAIPIKRDERPLLGFLSRREMTAILAAPDSSTWSGQRDQAMLTLFYNTGARVSEITRLRVADVVLGASACIHLHGKGRKQRSTPLWRNTARLLDEWLARGTRAPEAPVFPNRFGKPLSRSGVEQRLHAAIMVAQKRCPTLRDRRISPHTLRHTTAMHLLQSGVELTVIALWLGHESLETTHRYIEADLAMKQRALNSLQPPHAKAGRHRVTDSLIAFLDAL
jgi:site-specific recombinase XerD